MPLDRQVIDIPFTGELDESKSPYVMEPGTFTQLENVQYNRFGELVPRPTISEEQTYSATPGPSRMASFSDELVCFSLGVGSASWESQATLVPGIYSWSRSDVIPNPRWTYRGELPEYTNRRNTLHRDISYEVTDADWAEIEGESYSLFAYVSSADNAIHVRSYNNETGADTDVVMPGAPTRARGVRTVPSNDETKVGIFFQSGSNLYASYWYPGDATFITPIALQTNLASRYSDACSFDVTPHANPDMPGWVVAYKHASSWRQFYLDTDFITGTMHTLAYGTSTSDDAVGVCSAYSKVAGRYERWIGWNTDAGQLNYAGWTDAGTVISGATTLYNTGGTGSYGVAVAWTDNKPYFAVSINEPGSSTRIATGSTAHRPVEVGTSTTHERACLVSKLWTETSVANELPDGDMSDVGTSSWSTSAATLSKVSSVPPGATAAQSLRVTATSTSDAWAYQFGRLDRGATYRVTGWYNATGSGGASPAIWDGYYIAGDFSNTRDWRAFSITFTATDTNGIGLGMQDAAAGRYVDWHDVRVQRVDAPGPVTFTRVYGYTFDRETAAYHLCEFTSPNQSRRTLLGAAIRPVTMAAAGEADLNKRSCVGKLQNVSGKRTDWRSVALPVSVTPPVGADAERPNYDLITGFDRVRAKWNDPDAYGTAQVGEVTYIGGGILLEYDGRAFYENSFLQDPWITWRTQSVGAVLTTGSNYGTALVYEWTDALGRKHSSRVSQPSLVLDARGTPTTYQQIFKGISLSMRDEKRSRPRMTIYNTAPDSTTFYRDRALDDVNNVYYYPSFPTTWPSGSRNDRDNYWNGIRDVAYGAPETWQPVLYASPDGSGEQSNFPMYGGAVHLCSHKNRLWCVSAEKRNKVYYSKEDTPGEGLAFYPPGFELSLPVECTGLASLGDTLVAFTEDKVYSITGDGPDNRGSNGTFSLPTALPSDVGCTQSRSIVAYELGVFFMSKRGLMLLTRGGDVTEVGDEVRDSFNGDVTVYSAVHLPRKSQIRWYTSAGVFVYDYNNSGVNAVGSKAAQPRWYRWTHVSDLRQVTHYADEMWGLTQDGRTINETSTGVVDYGEAAYWRAPKWKTGWMNLGKLNEYKRAWKVGLNIKTDASCSVRLSVYDSEGRTQDKVFTGSVVQEAMYRNGLKREHTTLVAPLANQVSRAFMISGSIDLPDNFYDFTAPLFTFIGCSFDVGLKPGIRRR